MKSEYGKHYKISGIGLSMVFIISLSALAINQRENSTGQGQQEAEEKQNTTISESNFSYILNNTFNLGNPVSSSI